MVIEGQRDSGPDTLRAAARLASSRSAWAALRWLLAAVVLPCAGWVAAKLDTTQEIRDLRSDIVHLTRQQSELVGRIDSLTKEPDGAIPVLRKQDTGIRRAIVVSTAAALAAETSKRRNAKLASAQQLAAAYDRQISQLVPSAAAAESVLTNIAP